MKFLKCIRTAFFWNRFIETVFIIWGNNGLLNIHIRNPVLAFGVSCLSVVYQDPTLNWDMMGLVRSIAVVIALYIVSYATAISELRAEYNLILLRIEVFSDP